ncbi:crossover junction endodeoxyribonuclease RuvC [Patescibacteria group bacterium]|nr:crossover junction endodeoxyribonuclease RuvC [Patescibacteria group bacterium]
MIVLGIDPGTATTGYGLLKKQEDRLDILDYGCIETSPQEKFSDRLCCIYQDLTCLLKKFKPDEVAVEELFFAKNVATALKVSEARGVVVLTCRLLDIPVFEYKPLQVKQAVTSYGGAPKKQVQEMVKLILKMEEIPTPDDAADALALAICHQQFQEK